MLILNLPASTKIGIPIFCPIVDIINPISKEQKSPWAIADVALIKYTLPDKLIFLSSILLRHALIIQLPL